jgi:short-subunit dehydrogenase
MEIRGKRVLITGASRGIGEALARRFAGAGASVALVARSAGPLEVLAKELDGTAHPCDLADPAAVAGLFDAVEGDGGPVDVLVNNAGIGVGTAFQDCSAADLALTTQVNYLAAAELCRQALGPMLRRGSGHLVNVSSLAGVGAFPGLAVYSASKAALSHFTAGLRADLRGLPVGTTLVELGPIPTDMLDQVDSYKPTADSFQRFYRLKLLVDVPKETVADAVLDAVAKGRRHVRIPKRAIAFPMISESPRRIVELLLTGVDHR